MIRERKLGKSHPDTALAMNNLANCHSDCAAALKERGEYAAALANYAEAESNLLTAMAIWEAAHGATGVEVASACSNLGHMYSRQAEVLSLSPLYLSSLSLSSFFVSFLSLSLAERALRSARTAATATARG